MNRADVGGRHAVVDEQREAGVPRAAPLPAACSSSRRYPYVVYR